MLDLQTCTLWTDIAIVFAACLMLMCHSYSMQTLIFTAIWATLLVLLVVGATLTMKKLEKDQEYKKLKDFRSVFFANLFLIMAWSVCYCRMHDHKITMKISTSMIAAINVGLYAFMMYYSRQYFGYFIPIAAWTVIATGFTFYKM